MVMSCALFSKAYQGDFVSASCPINLNKKMPNALGRDLNGLGIDRACYKLTFGFSTI